MGYKWKTLINDPETGKRFQVMQMNKPKDHVFDPAILEARKMKPK